VLRVERHLTVEQASAVLEVTLTTLLAGPPTEAT
jgi:hypothetical protein